MTEIRHTFEGMIIHFNNYDYYTVDGDILVSLNTVVTPIKEINYYKELKF